MAIAVAIALVSRVSGPLAAGYGGGFPGLIWLRQRGDPVEPLGLALIAVSRLYRTFSLSRPFKG